MDERAFDTLADRTLAALQEQIETGAGDALDADLRGGILTLEFENGRQYVINKHGPNRQIWLSSPVSGAAHFDYDPAQSIWRSTRGPETLHALLQKELSELTGESVTLGPLSDGNGRG